MPLEKCNSGGLLLTYWCNAECAICYEYSGPNKTVEMPRDDLRVYLSELKRLGCEGSGFHFAGGEPFRSFRLLIDAFEAAREEEMLPLGKLETNGFWCVNDEIVRNRLTQIRDFGLIELLFSADVFHQEFVPIEYVQRGVRIAQEVLGEDCVRVRRWEYLNDPIDMMQLDEDAKQQVFKETLDSFPERMTGRAAEMLSDMFPKKDAAAFNGSDCSRELLHSRHIHIDPYGNVFPVACSGLILGNAKRLTDIYENFDLGNYNVIRRLAERGPTALIDEAVELGFEINEKSCATKCHLCTRLRAFFFQAGAYPKELGPREVYGG